MKNDPHVRHMLDEDEAEEEKTIEEKMPSKKETAAPISDQTTNRTKSDAPLEDSEVADAMMSNLEALLGEMKNATAEERPRKRSRSRE